MKVTRVAASRVMQAPSCVVVHDAAASDARSWARAAGGDVEAASYLVGRKQVAFATLAGSAPGTDFLVASERLDGQTITGTYRHATFANVSFKAAVIQGAIFEDCTFANCYFRGTRIDNAIFKGCRFIECDLNKIDVRNTELKFYNQFADCFINYGQLSDSLPSEPNLKAHLCHNMASEARAKGALGDAGRDAHAGAKAREEHLLSAAFGRSQFYKDKYSGAARAATFLAWAASRLRGYAWGYKRSFLVVLRNWLVATFIVFPALFLLDVDSLGVSGRPSNWTVLPASLSRMLPGAGFQKVDPQSVYTSIVSGAEGLSALLFGSLAASLLVRAILDRRP